MLYSGTRTYLMTPMSTQDTASLSAEMRLLDAARKLFCRDGIHTTGVARVIDEASVARRTLYERYGSKENLLRAVFEREASMWYYWFDVVLPDRHSGAGEQLLGLFDILHDWFSSEDFYGCIFINAVAEHDKTTGWVREIALAHLACVNARILALVRKTGVKQPREVTDQLSMLIDGAIVSAMMTRSPVAAHTAKRTANAILGF